MLFSIIICTYNRDKYIYKTLEHIATCGYPKEEYEIVLINNNSTDATEAECNRFAQTFPDIPFRYFIEERQGLSYARNRGMSESKGEWLVFLDDDAFVEQSYLQNLQRALAAHPDAVAFGGRIVPFYEDGINPDWMGKWSLSWVSALDKGKKTLLFKKDYPIGANMGIKRTFSEKAGEFNVSLGRCGNNLMGGEEKDFFNRIKKESDKIYYFPSVRVEHCIPPARLTKDFIRRLAYGIGQSERERTLHISKPAFCRRCFSEMIKWCASLLILFFYTVALKPQKGTILLYFRFHVSKGLFC